MYFDAARLLTDSLNDLRPQVVVTCGDFLQYGDGYPHTRSAAPVEMRVSCSTACAPTGIVAEESAADTLRGKISTTRAIKS